MLLRVNPKRTFWGYDGFWFTSDDPDPQSIDLNDLGKSARETFEKALEQGDLFEVDKQGNQIKRKKKLRRPVANLKVPVNIDSKEEKFNIGVDPVIEKKLRTILSGGVTSIRREVALIENAQFLSAAIGLEKEGKNRKTVIKLLKKQMEKSADYSSPMNAKGNIYDNLIEEEKGEDVELNMQRLDIESASEEIVRFMVN